MKRNLRLVIFTFTLIVVMFLVTPVTLIRAGEKEELQLQLKVAVLEMRNAQLAFQNKANDDPSIQKAKQGLEAIDRLIRDKGFTIQQKNDGSFEVVPQPPEAKPSAPEKK